MAQLPELQKKVLAMYYYENMQLSEIAAIFGVTESRICQIRGQAVALLRDYWTKLLAGARGTSESSAGKYHTLF
jgi:RNA polymerase sigma factor FliA